MLDQDAVERAASEVATRVGWHVVLVHPSGRTGWTINFNAHGRFRTVTSAWTPTRPTPTSSG